MRLKRGRKKQKQAWYQSMDNDRSCISKPTPRKSNMPTHTLIVRIEPRGLSFLYPYNMLSLSLSLFSPIFFSFLRSWLLLWCCTIVRFSTPCASYRTHYHIQDIYIYTYKYGASLKN